MVVTIIGVGLIGGSMAISLKENRIASRIIGVEANELHSQRALQLGLVDEMMDLEIAVKSAGLIIVAIPCP